MEYVSSAYQNALFIILGLFIGIVMLVVLASLLVAVRHSSSQNPDDE